MSSTMRQRRELSHAHLLGFAKFRGPYQNAATRFDSPLNIETLRGLRRQREERVSVTKREIQEEKTDKRRIYLPTELWDMILNEVNCVSSLSKLCQVSHTLNSLATPKLYKNLGLIYKGATEVEIFNPSMVFTDASMQQKNTPFTSAHYNYLRYVHSLTITDERRDSPCSNSINEFECTKKTCRRCGAALQFPDSVYSQCGVLGEIMLKIPNYTKVCWLRGRSEMGIPEELLEILGRKGSPSLRSLQLNMSGWTNGSTFPGKVVDFFENISGLTTLELTGVSGRGVLNSVGKYLQSPSGKAVRSLKLEGSQSGAHMHIPISDLKSLLEHNNDNSQASSLPELESLQLRYFMSDTTDRITLSSLFNPNTLTTLRLISCPFLTTRLYNRGDAVFPNLKVLHLGGDRYDHNPQLYNALPMLEELYIGLDARAERNFQGGVTKYLQSKGSGLKRLGVTFTRARLQRTESLEIRLKLEREFMKIIGKYCRNLEELGIWETDLYYAEKIITKLPKLRAVSLNLSSDELVSNTPNPSGPSYPMNVAAAHSIFYRADTGNLPVTPSPQGQRAQLKYIKFNCEAWVRLEPFEATKPSTDRIMPTMTIRRLSRKDASEPGSEIPWIFMLEKVEQREEFWGCQPSQRGPLSKFLKPTLNGRYMKDYR